MPPSDLNNCPEIPRKRDVSRADYHRLVAEHVSDVISVHSLDGDFEFVSPSAYGITGYTPEELVGTSPYLYLHPEDVGKVVRPNHEMLLKRHRQNFRCRFQHKEGHYVWLEVTNDYITDEEDNIWKLITSSRDITLRKSLEDRIHLFENIVEVATDAILVTDPEVGIIYANPVFEQRTGYFLSEVRGKNPGHFLQGPDTDPKVVEAMRKAVRDREIGTFEILNYRRNGEPFYVRVLIQPLYDRLGNHEGFFSLQQDITIEKAARDEMEQLNVQLQEKNRKLKTLNKDLEEFAYIASHDLKEPLRNVLGLVHLFEETAVPKLDENESELVELIRTTADRMSGMIESLLDYSRTGYPTEEVTEIDVKEVIESIRQDFCQIISRKKASLSYDGPGAVLMGYPTAFHRLLQNLVSNSLKHGKEESPRIEIMVTEHRHNWKISVADDGPGIPPDAQARIFKLFNRLSESPDSNGIGLALCKRIAELHRGRIGVNSTPGKGATFNITISKYLDEQD